MMLVDLVVAVWLRGRGFGSDVGAAVAIGGRGGTGGGG